MGLHTQRKCTRTHTNHPPHTHKMRIIAARWTGLNKQEVFVSWRLFTQRSRNQSVRDKANASKLAREKEVGDAVHWTTVVEVKV